MPLGFGGGGTTVYFANQICRIVRRAYEHRVKCPGQGKGSRCAARHTLRRRTSLCLRRLSTIQRPSPLSA